MLFAKNSPAQSLNVTIDQVHEIKELGIDINIKAITKDTCNQIWVGADNGLYRFDGKTVKRFNFKYVKVVKKRRNDRIVVLTDNGLFEIATLAYHCQIDTLLLSSKEISDKHLFYPKSLYEDKFGTLWIGEDREIVRYKNDKVKRFQFKNITSSSFLHRSFNFGEDGFGQLWATAYDGKLLRYDFEKEAFSVEKANLWNEVSSVATLGNDKIWLGTKNGIYEVRVNAKGAFLSSTKISDIVGVSKIETTNKYALVATWENGMYQLDFQGNSKKINSLRYAQIFDFFIEKDAVWIASRENILMLYQSSMDLIANTQNKFTPSISLLKDSRLIINTGTTVYLTASTYQGLSQQLLFDAQDQFWINDAILVRDTLWITASNGIYTFDSNNQQLSQAVRTKRDDWNDKFYMDSKGTIWISGIGETPVISLKNGQINYWDKLKKCLTIVEDERGNLYAAGENGDLFKQKNQDFEQLNLDLPSKEKTTIHAIQFSKDSLYLGTSQGLWVVAIDSISTQKPRLIFQNEVNSLAIDKGYNLWFGCSNGLMMLQGNDLYNFDRTNGLPSKYIVSRGLNIDINNQIWINTSKGVAKAKIDDLIEKRTPKPHIFALYSQNEKKEIKDYNLGVFNTSQSISIGMASLSFPSDNIKYKLTLYRNKEVFDRQQSAGLSSFFGLKQGDYLLTIWAKQSYAQWSFPSTYSFSVENLWYRTYWFYFLTLALISSLIVFITKIYNRRLRLSNEKLEALIKERTENIEQQKNELIENQRQIITQQKELIQKNTNLTETQKALNASEIQYLELKKNQMQLELDLKAKQLTTHTLNLVEKNQLLLEISKTLETLSKNKDNKETTQNIRKLSQQIKNSIKNDNHWESFRLYFEQVHSDFYTKLKVAYPNLTTNDLKQCALVKLNLSLEDSATLLGVSSESVRISRYRIQKKMDLTSQVSFYDFLMRL